MWINMVIKNRQFPRFPQPGKPTQSCAQKQDSSSLCPTTALEQSQAIDFYDFFHLINT